MLGSRSAAVARTPMWRRPSVSPTTVVVLPSPAGVGEMPVTSTSLPGEASSRLARYDRSSLAMCRPYGISASSGTPSVSSATRPIGHRSAASAISTSVGMSRGISLVNSPSGPSDGRVEAAGPEQLALVGVDRRTERHLHHLGAYRLPGGIGVVVGEVDPQLRAELRHADRYVAHRD